ncbi:virulence factor SrfC family protein [Tenacibaculum agarivorans]|uniref:virulence factor SrfC family protein n=1 Tax=Tenacibaculum agarivorans TaxID=1908389 RepID=UPI00094B82D3|nr:virulence factor SrfC family protein [Tenacibaculum agarivorans]
MTEKFDELKNHTEKTLAEIKKASAWIDVHGNESTKEVKKTQLNESTRTLNRVINALQKRSSVAIFGQSQVGKSFLVRSMAKSPVTGKLEILDATTEQKIDFLKDINPPGGRESTGIITRFSIEKPNEITNDFPYKLELLSQLDVAAIIINGYLEDIKDYTDTLDKEEVLAKVKELSATKDNQSTLGVSYNDVKDFNDYIITNFNDDYRIKYCGQINFFNDLLDLLPNITYNKRWELLQFFWGKNAFLTDIFNKISETLNAVNFSKVVLVNDKAIINGKKDPKFANTTNILDVERIKEMYYENPLDKLKVKSSDTTIVDVGVSELSALIKELHLQIPNDFSQKNEGKLLRNADILDFPGSKSREKVPEIVFNNNSEQAKLSMYVRGKVSYLFFLYNRDFGISTLLYCMDHEPPLVSESPSLLDQWIKRYIGGDIEERKRREDIVLNLLASEGVTCKVDHISPLLIAMTKFNVELTGKGAAERLGDPDSHNSKWFARFKENFSNYMSKPVQDKWTENWIYQNEPFKFVFPIRDPGFSESFFEGFEPLHQKETKLRPEKEAIIEDMKVSFLNSDITKQFIFDRETLWSELLTPNKTGIDYLYKYLEPSSHPINMYTQLLEVANKTLKNVLGILDGEHLSGDMDQELKKAKLKGAKSLAAITALSNKSDVLISRYFKEMKTTENEIWRLLYDFRFTVADKKEVEQTIDHSKIKDFLSSLGIELSQEFVALKQELVNFFGVDETDLNDILIDEIGVSIDELLKSNSKMPSVGEKFASIVEKHLSEKSSKIENEVFRDVFLEILKSKSIDGVKKEIANMIENELTEGGSMMQEKFNLLSTCITSIVNKYVFSSTWSYEKETEKPLRMGQPIFSNQGLLKDRSIVVQPIAKTNLKGYISDFSIGAKELYVKNVERKFGVDTNFDSASNEEIGNIINTLESFEK